MKHVSRMTQAEVGAFVQNHLSKRGIDVLLSGGATVAIYSSNAYVSKDVDLVNVYSARAGAHPSLDPELLADLEALKKCHQRQGIRAMVDFVIEMNLAAWIAVGILAAAPFLPPLGDVGTSSIVGPAALVLFFIYFVWRLLVHRGEL